MALAKVGAAAPMERRVLGLKAPKEGPAHQPVWPQAWGPDRLLLRGPSQGKSEALPPRDLRHFAPFLQDQVDRSSTRNACGTTSAAMVLSYWAGKPGAVTAPELDAHFRAFNGPTSPQNVAEALASRGLAVSLKQGSTLEELGRFVDQGSPAIVLVDPDGQGQDQTLHYLVVRGVERDASGRVQEVLIANPWGDEAPGPQATEQLQRWSAADFDRKWAKLHILGHGVQLDRVLIAALPRDDRPVVDAQGKTQPAQALWRPANEGLGLLPAAADLLLDMGNWLDRGLELGGHAIDRLGEAAEKLWPF